MYILLCYILNIYFPVQYYTCICVISNTCICSISKTISIYISMFNHEIEVYLLVNKNVCPSNRRQVMHKLNTWRRHWIISEHVNNIDHCTTLRRYNYGITHSTLPNTIVPKKYIHKWSNKLFNFLSLGQEIHWWSLKLLKNTM